MADDDDGGDFDSDDWGDFENNDESPHSQKDEQSKNTQKKIQLNDVENIDFDDEVNETNQNNNTNKEESNECKSNTNNTNENNKDITITPATYIINELPRNRGRGRGRGRAKYIRSPNINRSLPNYKLNRVHNNTRKTNKTGCDKYIQHSKIDEKAAETKDELKILPNINKIKLETLTIRIDEMNEQIQSLTNVVGQMQERLDNLEEQEYKQENEKPNDMLVEFNKIQQQIDELVKLQSGGTRNDNMQETEEDKVRTWMNNIVKLPEYTEIMIQNGYDDMENIVDITLEDLQYMGIEKIGHRRKIIKNAKKLDKMNEVQQRKRTLNDNVNQQQPVIAASYSNLSPWICSNCSTNNVGSSALCSLCGVNKSFQIKSEVEGTNVYDTAR